MQIPLAMGSEVTVSVGIDHGQFVACDPDAELDIDSHGDTATRHGLAIWGGNGGMTVFTASHWTATEVTVRLLSERPAVAETEWDHLVEGGLVLSNGRLHIYGTEDTGISEAAINLPKGSYSVIVWGRRFDSTDEYGDDGNDLYTLILWPGPPLDRRVLKDGFSWMG